MEELNGSISVAAQLEALTILRIANTAIYESRQAAKAAGIPIPILVGNQIKYELPDGRVVDERPDGGTRTLAGSRGAGTLRGPSDRSSLTD